MDTTLAPALLSWFHQHKRSLPWRDAPAGQRDPYRVWISEVMLQQTQVNTVIPYFMRWQEHFPNLHHVAQADLSAVLKQWEGLGYYRRARLLHQGAQRVIADYKGIIPQSYATLLDLPGIGQYTAAAIASLAFGEAVVAVDGNVKRVASRLFTLKDPLSPQKVAHHLTPYLPQDSLGDFNEALMELGATVCTAKTPSCTTCPLQHHCRAYQTASVMHYPPPKHKRAVPHITRYALIYVENDQLLLYKREPEEMLGGLWGFALSETLPENTATLLPSVKHAYTHFKITAVPALCTHRPTLSNKELMFIPLEKLPTLALSRLDYKILSKFTSSMP